MPGQWKKAPASQLLFSCLLPAPPFFLLSPFWKLLLVIGSELEEDVVRVSGR